MLGPSRFQFLNRAGELSDAESWNHPDRDKLWLYNLHYFDDLSAEGWQSRVDWHRNITRRWIAENPPSRGVGWDPYPTSLRIVNWIKWGLAGNALQGEHLHSLAVQARWLATRIEHHLGANHLLANAKALVFAGLYFDGPQADLWRGVGLQLLERELPKQILSDGGHYERSPMYQALILEDLLDLINGTRAWPATISESVRARWCETASRMFGWLWAMSHQDGEISFFNDAAFGMAPSPRALARYAERLQMKVSGLPGSLSASGYVRAERGSGLLLVDVAPVGPDHQPGHAHADTLAFEFSLFGHRVFVNSGTSTYERGRQRQFERSTAAHNTVEINGLDSSEVWDAFRVGRRARPHGVIISESHDTIRICGAHDGYRYLPGKPLHEREWQLGANRLIIADRISGRFDRATARFHLHPDVTLHGERTLQLPNGTMCEWSTSGGDARVVRTAWHPGFGRAEANQCLEVTLCGDKGDTMVVYVDW